MYQPASRRRTIRLILVYALMTVSVIVIATVLILVILGFSYNRQDGKIEQGGLLQFASIPSGATVTLDEVRLGTRTPNKATVDAKSHSVKMDIDGYRPWQKTIAVQPGGIGWLNYTRFVPADIRTEGLRTFPKLAGSLAASDRKWVAFLEDAAVPTIVLASIQGGTPEYFTLPIPPGILTPSQQPVVPHALSLEAWSDNDRYILVKRVYDTSKVEWILFDREDETRSVNISTELAISPSKVVFGNGSGRDLYVQTDDMVRRVNLDQQTLSKPLASNVEEFSVYKENTVLYTTKPDTDNKRYVGYFENGMQQSETVFSYPGETQNVHIAFGDYYKRYVAVTHDQTLELYSGTLPRGDTKADLRMVMSATLSGPTSRLAISSNDRFVVAQHPTDYTTYDIELKKTDVTTFKRPVAVDRPLQWLDNYIIWHDSGNMLRFYEFDGANQQDIAPMAEGHAATLSGDNRYIYFVSPRDDGLSFQRAKMIN